MKNTHTNTERRLHSHNCHKNYSIRTQTTECGKCQPLSVFEFRSPRVNIAEFRHCVEERENNLKCRSNIWFVWISKRLAGQIISIVIIWKSLVILLCIIFQNLKILKCLEILEIAAVLLNVETGVIECEFHCYVRPTRFPKLSDYCKQLTGITQSQVNSKQPFPAIYPRFISWLKYLEKKYGIRYTSLASIRASEGPNTTFCSWSNSDLKGFFRKQCERNKIFCPSYLKAWIDMSRRFKVGQFQIWCHFKRTTSIELLFLLFCSFLYQIKYSDGKGKRYKFSDALALANIQPVGRAHSALYDATNLASLVMHLIKIGLHFGIANDYYH